MNADQYQLGKGPVKTDPRTIRLADILEALPPPPAVVDNAPNWFNQGALGNDGYGDCVMAGYANLLDLVAAMLRGSFRCTAADVVAQYLALTGGQDTGLVELDFLKWAMKNAWLGQEIVAFAALDPRDMNLMAQAIYLCRGVFRGIELPLTAQAQVGSTWAFLPNTAGNQPGSWGGHCLAPGTRLLTDDLRWVPIESLQVGDALVGFDEEANGHKRFYHRSIVEAMETLELPCFELEFEDGTKICCSNDHLWMAGGGSGPLYWQRTDRLQVGQRASRMSKLFHVWEEDISREAGYLAAAFDGEGWLDGESQRAIHKAGFSQRDNIMLAKVSTALAERNIAFRRHDRINGSGYTNHPISDLIVNTTKANLARFLGSVRPYRLLEKFTADRFGACQTAEHPRLLRKTSIGVAPVVAVQTSTRTFIAEGFASHNCTIGVSFDVAAQRTKDLTWGMVQSATYGFWSRYQSESYAIITTETPGIDRNALELQLEQIGQYIGPTPIPGPGPLMPIVATAKTFPGQWSLSWNPAGGATDRYRLLFGDAPGQWVIDLETKQTSYSGSFPPDGQRRWVEVQAIDAAGNVLEPSSPVSYGA